jgi:hypothetical protein
MRCRHYWLKGNVHIHGGIKAVAKRPFLSLFPKSHRYNPPRERCCPVDRLGGRTITGVNDAGTLQGIRDGFTQRTVVLASHNSASHTTVFTTTTSQSLANLAVQVIDILITTSNIRLPLSYASHTHLGHGPNHRTARRLHCDERRDCSLPDNGHSFSVRRGFANTPADSSARAPTTPGNTHSQRSGTAAPSREFVSKIYLRCT